MRRIALVTLVVDDYDEAIRFYTEALGFRLVEDQPRPDGSRWVVVEPGTLVVAVDVGPATLAVLVFVTVLIRGTRTVLVCVMSTCCVRVQTPE